MTTSLSRLLAMLAVLLLSAAPALAQSDGHCSGKHGVPITDPIGIARVSHGKGPLHFVLGPEPKRLECPGPSPDCRARAFLMPGDVVLIRPTPFNSHLCASYVNAKGVETAGWLPAGRLVPVPAQAADEAQWIGSWRRTEASIRIRRGKQGGLEVEGEATWGAGDKRRVAAGAVNTGDFSGKARRAGNIVLVADDDITSFETAAKDRCAVRMRKVGPYLLVEDNMACGGMNVTFSGLYVRR